MGEEGRERGKEKVKEDVDVVGGMDEEMDGEEDEGGGDRVVVVWEGGGGGRWRSLRSWRARSGVVVREAMARGIWAVWKAWRRGGTEG